MNKKEKLLKQFKDIVLFQINRTSILVIILSIAINFGGHFLSQALKLPFWLDTIGTMLSAILYGPLVGAVVGAATSAFTGMISDASGFYMLVGVSVGVLTGFLFPRKNKDMLAIVSIAMLCGLVSASISTPLDIKLYDGMTGNVWGDALYDMLCNLVTVSHFNTMAGELFVDLPDRVLSIFIAFSIAEIVKKLEKNPRKKKKAKTAGVAILLIGALGASLLADIPVHAFNLAAEYEEVLYGADSGIMTSEVNAVEQTKDGYLWVGTYSGLYRYDGMVFEPVEVDECVRNVKCLYVDSRDRLWIGTNDSGVVCYDFYKNITTVYDTSNGLESDSIRHLCEDSKGNMYVATDREMSKITKDGKIRNYTEWREISQVRTMAALNNGGIVGVTYDGIIFLVRNDILQDTAEFKGVDGVDYRAVGAKSGEVLVGTNAAFIDRYAVENDELIYKDRLTARNGSYFNQIEYDRGYDLFFYCCENGMGYVDSNAREVMDFSKTKAAGSISDVCVDSQGNIWFASSKHGLMKYSQSPFRNLFRRVGIEEQVVNALLMNEGILYVGTDTGLEVVDTRTGIKKNPEIKKEIGEARVRHIYKDSAGNLWFSIYGNQGLLRLSPDGTIKDIGSEEFGTVGGRYRFVLELSDGKILASNNRGLSFIDGDTVEKTIGENDGLNNPTILCAVQREDGTVLAASDGDGIYMIKNEKVVGRIGKDDGLMTGVVLKIVPCSEGYLYVTSNAIYHDNGSEIRRLENFPYNNNFDIVFDENGNAWITSSAGLYVVSEDKLLADEEGYAVTLLNNDWGLVTTFTANSWNFIYGDDLYLCCADGVRVFAVQGSNTLETNYELHLKGVSCEEGEVTRRGSKVTIPATTSRISFDIAINNHTLSNPLIHYYLEGTDDPGITCFQNQVRSLSFTNLPYGRYKFHIEVLDEITGDVLKEKIYDVEKKAMMYETLFFKIYLGIVCFGVMIYFIWMTFSMIKRAQEIRGLKTEMVTDPMTGILNKAGVRRALEKACAEETGVLLMIDLDSFKLVNDLYGHDMGDKILIRFAELIKESIQEDDICGRLGGDEFTAFLKNTRDEEDVDTLCKALNRGIVKSAKEFMGEDMNIPLGASLGAVKVPDEGNEYEKCFRLADKALYIVKQNGKHGYAFFRKKSESQNSQQENNDQNNLAKMKQIIGERNEGKGAFLVNFDRMQVLYKYLCRYDRINASSTGFFRIFINRADGEDVPDEITESFEESLVTNLKKNDVVSPYSGNFYVLFVGASKDEYESAIKRVIAKWQSGGEYEGYNVEYEVDQIG